MRVVIYSRVSTSSQDNQRQIRELTEYCQKMKFDLLSVFEEKVSGSKKNQEREVLMEMIDFIQDNNVDKVLCWEMSRLGRNTLEVLSTIETLSENKISLFIKNFNIETLDEKGNKNPLSNLMIQILTSISEMERTQIRQRIKSGYDNYIKKGGKVGRKKGYKKSEKEILEEYKDVVKYLNKGRSVRETMKLTGRSNGTIMKVKRLIQ
ncbi:recombinase family protein [Aureitalea sp. L0-47]|uniref:recombinase family protein n=1 Tax=Aureitalea sp. L0-47 TaxID=2816962 RepID=UPI0022373639|nr:recombinase family protein [Aureitalea sp. L0-47]MCW5520188.1 recombinase family protein [Aureitalea sp. L0-47]